MRLLLETNLSPRLVELLTKAGLDGVQVAELGLLGRESGKIGRVPPGPMPDVDDVLRPRLSL